jgi:hypothetical protein
MNERVVWELPHNEKNGNNTVIELQSCKTESVFLGFLLHGAVPVEDGCRGFGPSI